MHTMQQVPVVMWCPLISSAQLFLKWVLSHVLVCRYVKNLMEQAGLAIREDPMGNIWGRLAGSEPKAGELTPREGDSTLEYYASVNSICICIQHGCRAGSDPEAGGHTSY